MEKKSTFQTLLSILSASLKLGLTSFGGPAAHLSYFRQEYVVKRKWLDEKAYADLIALCQLLPGPASSQVGIAIGTIRGGILGGIISWLGFTLPSVLLLSIFAILISGTGIFDSGWLHALKIVAVAVIAQAILGMGKTLTPDRERITIAILACILTLIMPTMSSQLLIILLSAIVGILIFKKVNIPKVEDIHITISKKIGVFSIIIFGVLLLVLPILSPMINMQLFSIFDTFYRVGSMVFGGGHVVLPLLEKEVVPNGWISSESFLAGYGATQAVPGPLFTFSSYIGAASNGWLGALVATVGIFLPSFFLVIAALPFWNALRTQPKIQSALMAVNAAVVGLLVAALYNPVWTSTIHTPIDFIFAITMFTLLVHWKVPPWVVVLLAIVFGYLFL
ncbi:chromate efflux transporter [Bacillus timonensis]|nr:chromate efflux transporter [Bacillus timonensis]